MANNSALVVAVKAPCLVERELGCDLHSVNYFTSPAAGSFRSAKLALIRPLFVLNRRRCSCTVAAKDLGGLAFSFTSALLHVAPLRLRNDQCFC